MLEAAHSSWISFKEARRGLSKKRAPTFSKAYAVLQRLRADTQAAKVLRKYAPETNWKGALGELLDRGDSNEILPIEIEAIQAVYNLFPVRTDAMEEYLLNLEPGQTWCIEIEAQGANWIYNDFYQMADDGGEYFDGSSLLVWARCMDCDLNEAAWPMLIEHFGWPERVPLNCKTGTRGLDNDRFEKLLIVSGLVDFCDVFNIVWKGTGSIFLDIDYDSGWENIELNLENVEKLVEEWKIAQPFLEGLQRAEGMVDKDSKVLERVMDIWERCLTTFAPRPRTLAELWGGEESDGVMIDPFYGPIGLQDDEEDEEVGE